MQRIGLFARVIDLLMPRACSICGSRLTVTEVGICASCNFHLPRTFFDQSPDDNDMVRLFWGVIPVERGVSWYFFEPHSQAARPIYSMKYNGNAELGCTLGRLFAEEIKGSGFFEDIDVIVPVPLAKKRERTRGYNQSLMISNGIAEATGLPVEKRALKRNAFVESQTRKNRWERLENVDEVFELRKPDRVAGRHVLIVDDVITTGATITACARELLKAGGVRISVLTLGMTKS